MRSKKQKTTLLLAAAVLVFGCSVFTEMKGEELASMQKCKVFLRLIEAF
jgi:hypothetical protein